MKIKLFGMSALLITSANGTKIFTDPYDPVPYATRYAPIKETADVVTITHEHESHNHSDSIGGNPEIYRGPEPVVIKGIEFRGLPTYHDDSQGKKAGNNTIIFFEVDGIRVCHLGDLGHRLSPEQLEQIGRVDILLIPVMGIPVMSLELTNEVTDQFDAKVVIPMHYWNRPYIPPVPRNVDWDPIFHVEDYLKDKENVVRMDAGEVEFEARTLPKERQIVFIKEAADLGAYEFDLPDVM